jgi:hypothetical protein
LFSILEGDTALDSTRTLTPAAENELQFFESQLSDCLTNKQFGNLLPFNDNLSHSISNYYGYIGNHYPAGKLWDFFKQTPFIINTIVKLNPIIHASVYYIDGSSLVKEAYMDLIYMKLFKLIILLHNR